MRLESIKLVYFSPTGGTRKILHAITNGIGAGKINKIDLTVPENRKNSAVSRDKTIPVEEDLVIIGVPVYAEKIPVFLNDCLKRIKGHGKPAVLVSVYGNIGRGIALNELESICAGNGFTVIGGASFIGEHTFSKPALPIAKDRPDSADLALAEAFGRQVRKKLCTNGKENDHSSMNYLKALEIKFPAGKLPLAARIVPPNAERLVTRQPAANMAACRKCGKCVRACSMGAIHPQNLQIDEKLCFRCMACVKNCPAGARQLVFKKKWIVLNYMRMKGRIRREPVIYL